MYSIDAVRHGLATNGWYIAPGELDDAAVAAFYRAVYPESEIQVVDVELPVPGMRRLMCYTLGHPLEVRALRSWMGPASLAENIGLTRVWYTRLSAADAPIQWYAQPNAVDHILFNNHHGDGSVRRIQIAGGSCRLWTARPCLYGPFVPPNALARCVLSKTEGPCTVFAVGSILFADAASAVDGRRWHSKAPVVWSNAHLPPVPRSRTVRRGGGRRHKSPPPEDLDDDDDIDDSGDWCVWNLRIRRAITALIERSEGVRLHTEAWGVIQRDVAEEVFRQVKVAATPASDGIPPAVRFDDHFVLQTKDHDNPRDDGFIVREEEPTEPDIIGLGSSAPGRRRRRQQQQRRGSQAAANLCPRGVLLHHVLAYVRELQGRLPSRWDAATVLGRASVSATGALILPAAFQTPDCRRVEIVARGSQNALVVGGRGTWRDFTTPTECIEVLRRLRVRGTIASRYIGAEGGDDVPSVDANNTLTGAVFSRQMNGTNNLLSLAVILLFLNPLVHGTEALAGARDCATMALGTAADGGTVPPTAVAWLGAWRKERQAVLFRADQQNPAEWDAMVFPLPPMPTAASSPSDDTTHHRRQSGVGASGEPPPPHHPRRTPPVVIHEGLRSVRVGPAERFAGVACAGDRKLKRGTVRMMAANSRRATQQVLMTAADTASGGDTGGTDGILGNRSGGLRIGAGVASGNALCRLAMRQNDAKRPRYVG